MFVMKNWGKGDKLIIFGLDGVGIIEELGEGIKGLKKGMEVIVNLSLEWDCGEYVLFIFKILGGLLYGIFVEYVII